MNLYNLKIFADTARLASMTKASELNNLSRPAVSHAIKKLELDLGVELLVHQRRNIELTQSGSLLLKKAEDLLSKAENIAFELRQGKGPLIRDFRIGSARTLATRNLPNVLEHLRNEYPDVSLQVQMANSNTLIQKLKNREIDLAFMIGDDSFDGSKQYIVGRGYFVLIKPKSKKDEVVSYAITEKRPETERLQVLFDRIHGRTLPVFAEIHSWDAIHYAVNQGICGGLIPDFLLNLKAERGESAFSVVIPKVFPYEIKVIHMAGRVNDPLIRSFLSHVKRLRSS